jgi:hypothetical protein
MALASAVKTEEFLVRVVTSSISRLGIVSAKVVFFCGFIRRSVGVGDGGCLELGAFDLVE